jgi:hypothetical protein
MINSIEADPFNDGGLYVAATLYKSGDFTPYLYHTKDYGATWRRIDQGIDREHFTRVIRADPEREGLLYAGTEFGAYVSYNNGSSWQPIQLNLPIVPITDMTIKDNKLIAATQGRSIWMIDDLGPIRQMDKAIARADMHLFTPADTYRMEGRQSQNPGNAGMNHPNGVMTYFYFKEDPDTTVVTLSYHDSEGTLIREFSTTAEEKKDKLSVEQGANYFNWDMLYPEGEKFEKMILWWASLAGPKAVPGQYTVKLSLGDKTMEKTFNILNDPRSESTDADMQAQFIFVKEVTDKVSEAHKAIKEIKGVRKQLNHYRERLEGQDSYEDIIKLANDIDSTMTIVEEELYQTKNRSRQDPLNFPIRLTNKLAHLNSLMRAGNEAPTAQAVAVKEELTTLIDEQLKTFKTILDNDIPKFNEMMRKRAVDAIILEEESESDEVN